MAVNLAMNLLKCRSYLCTNCLHTSALSNGKIGKAMRKVMGATSKKRRAFIETPILPTPHILNKGTDEMKKAGNLKKRNAMLSKIFMRNITDIMSTGQYCSLFHGLGIEINRVEFSPDFRNLNVYWLTKGEEKDELIEQVLKTNAGHLRHELSTLRLMGMVPTINFIKDELFAKVLEVDRLLALADFGEDHEPVQLDSKLKTQLELHEPLESNIKERIETFYTAEMEEKIEGTLPHMPQDVFGLNHEVILNRVKKLMKKSEAVHRKSNCEKSSPLFEVNTNPLEYDSAKEQREAFKQFLEKRELKRSKKHKEPKNFSADYECVKQELREREKEYFKNMDAYDNTDHDDYLDEEDVK